MLEEQLVIEHLKAAQARLSALVARSEGDRCLSYKAVLFSVEAALKAAETELKGEVACV